MLKHCSRNRDFVPDRDIILFDQRGTKYSIPNLYCSEIDKLIADTVEKRLTTKKMNVLAWKHCKPAKLVLSSENIDLSAFNSLENAADIEDLRIALGYKRINLYGVSYGTLLALHYMQMYPAEFAQCHLRRSCSPSNQFHPQQRQDDGSGFYKLV